MQFVLLIYQGTTPTPKSQEWKTFSDEEKKTIYAEYEALNKTPGLTPGLPLGLPQDATTVRVQNGRTLTTKGPLSMFGAPSEDTSSSRPKTSRPRSRWLRGSRRPDRDTPSREVLVAGCRRLYLGPTRPSLGP